MKEYESYKASGIEWLGMIPEHWGVNRTKFVVDLVNDKATDTSLKKVALENIESKTGKYIETETSYEGEGMEFRINDILFGKLRPYLAKVYLATFNGQSVGDIYIFRKKGNNIPLYLKYLFISDQFISVVDGATYGTKMPRASWDYIANIILPTPPTSEQTIIADYLDYKTGIIDEIISSKESVIRKLQEFRSSVISEAVTKGLNPNVEMKDSRIDWLKKIPSVWNLVKLKFLVNGSLKYGASEQGVEYDPLKSRYIRISDFNNNGELDENNKLSLPSEKAINYLLKDKDVLFARSGATVGKSFIFRKEKSKETSCCFAGYLIKAECNNNLLNPEYLYYFTNSNNFNDWKDSILTKATIENISADKYNELSVPLPPLVEQQTIITYLDAKTSKIDKTLTELQSQIEDMKQYKSSVIYEAVTGKVDLRDWKKPN